MSIKDILDEECVLCGNYHTKFVCKECYDKLTKKALTEVEKMIDKFKINIWKDERCFEGIKCKTCLPLDYIDEHIDKLEIELNKLKEKKNE